MLKQIVTLLFCLLSISAFSMEQKPIKGNQAFQFSVEPTTTDSILAKWDIAPGYYLYKDRFSFEVLAPKEAQLGFILKPIGIEKNDQILGKHYVYEGPLTLSIPILNPTNEPLKLLVHYQGCAKWGFCYPPITKLVSIANRHILTANDIQISNYEQSIQTTTSPVTPTANNQAYAAKILQDKNSFLSLLIFFGFGILLAFTPCILPIIPILSGIIVDHGHNINTRHAVGLSLFYVLGMALAFAIAGLIVGLLGSSVQAALQTPWVLVLFSLLFVMLALSLFGFYDLKLPQNWQHKVSELSHKQKTGNYIGVAIMGALSTLIVSPCVSAPLVGALAYIGNSGNAVFGGLALFFMGLGMGLPLIIVGASFGKLLPKAGHWMINIKNFFGVLMLGVAIWMLERIIPGPASLALWAILAIVCAIFMGALSPTKDSRWTKLSKGLGLALLIYGFLLLIGAAMGNDDVFQPIKLNPSIVQTSSLSFQPVTSIASVDASLQQNQGKLVMLDFYADWCVSCKEMDANAFSNSDVKKLLKKFVLLRANVTANNTADKALEKNYGVIAPPTILFFNKEGEEISSARIVGEMNAQQFLTHVKKITESY